MLKHGPGGSRPTALWVVHPHGEGREVSPTGPFDATFTAPMGWAMEHHLDLHTDDLSGPVVPMTCSWSPDRTALTCRPDKRLNSGARYAFHFGGAMRDSYGRPVDLGRYGAIIGGRWVMGPVPEGTHGGVPWRTAEAHWRGANGRYGMVFFFTTS